MRTLALSGEVERLLRESLRPPVAARRGGRFYRDPAPEWDWYYLLPKATQRRVLAVCSATGSAPDVVAMCAGFDDVDEWARELVAAVCATRAEVSANYDSGAYDDTMLARDLVGPVEIAEMLQVNRDTVYAWVNRQVLPAPWATISGTRLWARGEIEDWARDTNRLPRDEVAF